MPQTYFDTPAHLLRAVLDADLDVEATELRLRQLRDKRHALRGRASDFLANFPQGVTYRDRLFTRCVDADGRPSVRYTAAPFDVLDLDGWELREAEEDVPGYTAGASAIADHYPDVDGPLALAGIEVRDDEGDDH